MEGSTNRPELDGAMFGHWLFYPIMVQFKSAARTNGR